MRIAFVSQALPYLPSRGGFRLYGANLIRCLSLRHAIDLISLLREDDPEHLDWPKPYCSSIQTIPTNGASVPAKIANLVSSYAWGRNRLRRDEIVAAFHSGLKQHKWDVIHIEGDYVGGLVPPDLPVAKVLSLHDSWTLRCQEMLKCSQSVSETLYYRIIKFREPRYERLVYPRFERCTVVADPDLVELRKVVPNARVDLIPYGTDTEYFHPIDVAKEPRTLVFHSHLGYAPNIDAALEFANNIFPLIQHEVPDVVFHVVGADPGPKILELGSRPGIKISANLQDLRPAVCSAAVYVCPIRYGTGLKSKMLEAMAMRMPIVGYHPGSTVGIACTNGKQLLAAAEPAEFAAHVIKLLGCAQYAQELAREARKLVEEKYSWDSRAIAYEQLYSQVIEEHRARNSNGAHGLPMS